MVVQLQKDPFNAAKLGMQDQVLFGTLYVHDKNVDVMHGNELVDVGRLDRIFAFKWPLVFVHGGHPEVLADVKGEGTRCASRKDAL